MSPTATQRRALGATAAVAGLAALLLLLAGPSTPAADATTKTVAVRITGGHALNPVDGGRPVVLVAAGLGVPADVFRTAFSGVTPAAAGTAPEPGQVHDNKDALLAVLAPYGIVNDQLDAVSDHYRYVRSAGETWPQTPARAQALVRDGRVVSVRLTRPGAGYTSAPRVTVPGHPSARVAATVAFGTDLATNGRVATLRLR